jgi:peptidyl-prolyl cis-trans isomerase B (cyclophilin B)
MKMIFISLITTILLFTGCDNSKKDVLVDIHTKFGTMRVLLYDEAPLHKSNFLELASKGRYDSTQWHRIMKDFMVQGGDVAKKEGKTEDESDRIPAEINQQFIHVKGALAAARQPDQINPQWKSSASQFYIVHGKVFSEKELTIDQYALNQGISELLADPSYDTIKQKFVVLQQQRKLEEMNELAFSYIDLIETKMGISLKQDISPERLKAYTTLGGAPHLDNEYTIFGKVVEGVEVIDKLAAVQVDRKKKPIESLYLTMELVPMKKKDVTAQYGYEYADNKK